MRWLPASLAVLAALTAGCNQSSGTPSMGLRQPSSVAVFTGYTTKNPRALRPYVAVANSGRDEIILIDAVDDEPVLAPIEIRALSVPSGPMPTQVVAGELNDGLPDLLVVVPAGSGRLQLVKTWDQAGNIEVLDDDTHNVEFPATVTAIVTAPVPGATDARIRVVAALAGGQLRVVEYERSNDGTGAIAPVSTEPAVQDLTFEVVSLAVNPEDPSHVYAASPDPIAGGVEGVAEFDATGTPGNWAIRALDAGAPTLLVAAWRLAERKLGTDAASTERGSAAIQDPEVDRVYAYLDPAHCGADQEIACGIAVIDPATGTLRDDPAGLLPSLPPIYLPSAPVAMVVSKPPTRVIPGQSESNQFMRITAGGVNWTTTAVMAVPAADGRVYLVDLARWAVPNANNSASMLVGETPVGLASYTLGAQQLGIWFNDTGGHEVALTLDDAEEGVTVTPGFTPDETWTVTYQGVLPGLENRLGEIRDAGGALRLALQVTDDILGPTQVVRVYDPTLGIRVGDLAVINTAGLTGCSTTTSTTDAAITGFVMPDGDTLPGGALLLNLTGACADTLRSLPTVVVTIRAGGGEADGSGTTDAQQFLVTGARIGYAGRVVRSRLVDGSLTGEGFTLQHEDESALDLACPLIPWPVSGVAVACDETCRAECEQLVLARKARRFYLLSESCTSACSNSTCKTACDARFPSLANDPDTDGPAVAFRVGLAQTTADPNAAITRDLSFRFTTRDGLVPSNRTDPSDSSATPIRPYGAATFDRSPYDPAAGYRFFVPYVDGHVLDFSPAVSGTTVIR